MLIWLNRPRGVCKYFYEYGDSCVNYYYLDVGEYHISQSAIDALENKTKILTLKAQNNNSKV